MYANRESSFRDEKKTIISKTKRFDNVLATAIVGGASFSCLMVTLPLC